jgi:signal transduction histidine kinase
MGGGPSPSSPYDDGAVSDRRARRTAAIGTWLPVAVLAPLLVLDAAFTAEGPPVTPLAVLAAVVGCLPLTLRSRLPFVALAPLLTAGIVLVLWQLEPANTIVLIPMVALAEVASRVSRRRSVWMGIAVVPCVVVSILPFADDPADFLAIFFEAIPFCLLALASGDIVRSRREALERTMVAREEEARRRLGEERLRIAREVHDVVAHAMVAINVQAGVAAHVLDRDPDQARSALREIKATSGAALTDLRGTLGVLRDPDGAAPVAPASRLEDLDDLAAGLRAAGVDVTLVVDELPALPAAVHAAGYRIVQEALTNVLRHAQRPSAVRVHVAAREGSAVEIEILDDGADAGAVAAGHGTRGMRERAAAFDGTLTSGPAASGGWRVTARLPIAPPPAGSA